MKKGLFIFNIVLSVAVIVLFVLVLKPKSTSDNDKDVAVEPVKVSESTLVYVNTDSLLLNYEYAKHLNEVLLKKEEKSRTDFNEKAKAFQQEATEFQRKVQNNGFLSLERAKAEEQGLAQKERDLQDLNTRLSNQLMVEQSSVSAQLRDSLVTYLKELQPKMKFTVVLSNSLGDNVLYSQPGLDITSIAVKGLNARYQASSKK
jgi:outer membrane protein